MATKRKGPENLITVTDDRNVKHVFELLEVFLVNKQHYAVLHPKQAPKNEVAVLRALMGRDGKLAGFEQPTEKEFNSAVKALESRCECQGHCGEHCDEGHGGRKAPAARKPAKKAAKKVAKKRAAPRRSR